MRRKGIVSARGVEVGERFDFLGYTFSRERNLMRKQTKKRFVRKARASASPERHKQILASYWGICVHGQCRNLWNKITNNDMSFASIGIKKRDRIMNGQKFFDVPDRRIIDLLNVPITVLDVQKDVSTRQGPGRYCVLCEQNGERFKFITNSLNIKDVLDQALEAEENGRDVFPVTGVVIKRKSLGDGKSCYYFEE